MSDNVDWTCGPDGESNSSALYTRIVDDVARTIVDSAYTLVGPGPGNTTVARLIVSRLAHVFNMAPLPKSVPTTTLFEALSVSLTDKAWERLKADHARIAESERQAHIAGQDVWIK